MSQTNKPVSDFWAITAFFNPYRNVLMKERFHLYCRAIQMQGAKQLVVELVFEGALPELSSSDADRHIVLYGTEMHLMWQKEALLNIALDSLPESCRYVAWLDGDIFFENDQWVKECKRELDDISVLQPFSEVRYLTPEWGCKFGSTQGMSQNTTEKVDSFAAGFVKYGREYLQPYGFTGCAWAATKKFLQQCRFFPYAILGDGDSLHAYGFTGMESFLKRVGNDFPKALINRYLDWANHAKALCNGRIGLVQGAIYHINHGSLKKRAYRKRRAILKNNHYDPTRDITTAANGVLCWNTEKSKLKNEVKQYFSSRIEDNHIMEDEQKRILITGMSGVVGGIVGSAIQDEYPLRALTRRQITGLDSVTADLRDSESIEGCMNGIDTVLHFASYNGNDMSRQIDINYRGTWNLFEEAIKRGVRRFVYMSSGAVQQAYETEGDILEMINAPDAPLPDSIPTVSHQDEIRPTRAYGAMKAAVESLARMYSETTPLSVICLRLGRVRPDDQAMTGHEAAVYLSHRDLIELVRKSIEAPASIKFGIYYGVSDNRTRFRDLEAARRDLGFVPRDGINKLK